MLALDSLIRVKMRSVVLTAASSSVRCLAIPFLIRSSWIFVRILARSYFISASLQIRLPWIMRLMSSKFWSYMHLNSSWMGMSMRLMPPIRAFSCIAGEGFVRSMFITSLRCLNEN